MANNIPFFHQQTPSHNVQNTAATTQSLPQIPNLIRPSIPGTFYHCNPQRWNNLLHQTTFPTNTTALLKLKAHDRARRLCETDEGVAAARECTVCFNAGQACFLAANSRAGTCACCTFRHKKGCDALRTVDGDDDGGSGGGTSAITLPLATALMPPVMSPINTHPFAVTAATLPLPVIAAYPTAPPPPPYTLAPVVPIPTVPPATPVLPVIPHVPAIAGLSAITTLFSLEPFATQSSNRLHTTTNYNHMSHDEEMTSSNQTVDDEQMVDDEQTVYDGQSWIHETQAYFDEGVFDDIHTFNDRPMPDAEVQPDTEVLQDDNNHAFNDTFINSFNTSIDSSVHATYNHPFIVDQETPNNNNNNINNQVLEAEEQEAQAEETFIELDFSDNADITDDTNNEDMWRELFGDI